MALFSSAGKISVICMFLTIAATFFESHAAKYPFKADFDIRAVSYQWSGQPVIGFNLINNGPIAYDSLQIRLYLNETQEQMSISGNPDDTNIQFCARLDIGILYQADGFPEVLSKDMSLHNTISKTRLQKISGIFDSTSGKYGWYFPIDLGTIASRVATRLRLDLIWDARVPFPPYEDHLVQAPRHTPGVADWSWGAKLRSEGFPADFAGIPEKDKETLDNGYWQLPVNPYIAVFRNDELLWGIPPDWKKYYNSDTFDTVPRPAREPMPYDPIAVPFDDYTSQLQRDSANCHISPIRVNQAGYCPGNKHYFYHVGPALSFAVVNDSVGSIAGNGILTEKDLTVSGQLRMTGCSDGLLVAGGQVLYTLQSPVVSGKLCEGILPDLPEGKYRIVVASDSSAPFVIRKDVYNMVKDALLKFYGANRCGDSKSWLHKPCHLLDPVTGGWHDCGDHLKEGATMGYTASVLGLAAAVFEDRDQDMYDANQSHTRVRDGIPDILYEAKHGADFILQSFDKAGGDVATMITSVGDFAKDHSWWGLPEIQDNLAENRGGPPRTGRKEVTSDYLGNYAANLAFVSKRFKSYDDDYAAKCLAAAQRIYAFTKDRRDRTDTPAYMGSSSISDDLAFACLALLWATSDRKYLDELCFDTTIGEKAVTSHPKALFGGGWFAHNDPAFHHGTANTGWGDVHAHVLWGFYRLILDDKTLCSSIGLSEEQRLSLIEKTVYTLIANLGSVGDGKQIITLPDGGTWLSSSVKYELPWFTMRTQMEWVWNRYQAGNIAEMYYYYDIASRIQGLVLPNTPATVDWQSDSVKAVLVRMLDYMLGVNPWDVSMITGVGFKNFNHPHHRASNPELRTTPNEYEYRPPVGALVGGYLPTTSVYAEKASDYAHTEVGIEGTTTLLMPVCGLSCVDRMVKANIAPVKSRTVTPQVRISQLRHGFFSVSSNIPVSSVIIYTLSGRVVSRSKFSNGGTDFSIVSNGRVIRGSGCYVVRIGFCSGEYVTKRVTAAGW